MEKESFFRRIYRTLNFNRLLNKRLCVSCDDAYCGLRSFLKRDVPLFSQQNTVEPQFDLMIIVPVYNTERYLKKCVDSLLNQKTHYKYQAVFINDGSSDDSGEILHDLIMPPHRIITVNNKGASAARNIALKNITGRYTMFADSDDYFPDDSVERLMQVADTYSADIVEGGYADFNESGIFGHTSHSDIIRESNANELFGFPWCKVIKSELLKDFCFPEGYLLEDTVMAALLYPQAETIFTIPNTVYYYRDNLEGITHSNENRKESVDSFWMMKYCLEERLRRNYANTKQIYLRYIFAVYRNWIRMRALPEDVKKWTFVLTSELFESSFSSEYPLTEKRAIRLAAAMKKRSYEAYKFILDRWDIN